MVELPPDKWRYLSSLHEDFWKVEGDLREQRYETFIQKVKSFKHRGFDVREFEERAEKYELSKKIQERGR